MEIKNILICGFGALGIALTYKLSKNACVKILVDELRYEKYNKIDYSFNGNKIKPCYILPNKNFTADLIIITTKFEGLKDIAKNIPNFINNKTIIITLTNGISAEKYLKNILKNGNVIYSYYLGDSVIKKNENVINKEFGKIYIGNYNNETLTPVKALYKFFNQNNIQTKISENIIYSLWVKFGVNIVLNQLSAISGLKVGDLKKCDLYKNYADKLLDEVLKIAEFEKIQPLNNLKKDVYKSINQVADYGITSMLQDVLQKRKTEVEIFSGEIINLAKIYNIKTPYNKEIYTKIKSIEQLYIKKKNTNT